MFTSTVNNEDNSGTESRPKPDWRSAHESLPSEPLKVPRGVVERLRCPACRSGLRVRNNSLLCADPACGLRFPIVDAVPVLIHDGASLFSRNDFVARRNTTMALSRSQLKEWADRVLPVLGRNLKAEQNYAALATLLEERYPDATVLVIGGSILGKGLDILASRRKIQLVETDVSFGPRTQIICDAHDLPFANHSFHGVVVQAVLQYVPDPTRCVQEIERVLKPGGLVYAETAFMQQVVHGRYDFTRFTHLGLRRLFRAFTELASGPVAGPGMALAWAGHFFLLSFAASRRTRAALHALARLFLFWLKYFDRWLLNKPGTYDAASGFYFLGARGTRVLSDRELVRLYRGAESL